MQRLALAPVALGLGVSAGGVARAAAAGPASSRLDKLAWLGGCWESATDERVTVEMWLPPAGGLMVGASRTVAGDEARAFEHLRLHIDGATLVYTAIPSGQKETDFRSTAVHEAGFTVEECRTLHVDI